MPPGLIEEENSVSAQSDFWLRSHREIGFFTADEMAFTIVHGHALVARRTDRWPL